MNDLERALTPEQAAKIVYNTAAPDRGQVERIRSKIQDGSIRRSARGGITTTPRAIADYLAKKTAGANPRKSQRAAEGMPNLYRELLKDYFLAVLLRRKVERRSNVFAGLVIAMQLAIITLPILSFVWVYRTSIAGALKSPERIAVERWLEANTDEYGIESMTGTPASARVKYWYQNKGSKRITTDRIFTIAGESVTSVDMAN
jgi:hypothetical protein